MNYFNNNHGNINYVNINQVNIMSIFIMSILCQYSWCQYCANINYVNIYFINIHMGDLTKEAQNAAGKGQKGVNQQMMRDICHWLKHPQNRTGAGSPHVGVRKHTQGSGSGLRGFEVCGYSTELQLKSKFPPGERENKRGSKLCSEFQSGELNLGSFRSLWSAQVIKKL